jgi:hypothetical protein
MPLKYEIRNQTYVTHKLINIIAIRELIMGIIVIPTSQILDVKVFVASMHAVAEEEKKWLRHRQIYDHKCFVEMG